MAIRKENMRNRNKKSRRRRSRRTKASGKKARMSRRKMKTARKKTRTKATNWNQKQEEEKQEEIAALIIELRIRNNAERDDWKLTSRRQRDRTGSGGGRNVINSRRNTRGYYGPLSTRRPP